MATIGTDSKGRRRILFVGDDGRRRTLYLGKVSKSQAQTVKTHVEQIVHAQRTQTAPPKATSDWLADVGPQMRDRMARVKLTAAPTKARTLGELAKEYADAATCKASTLAVYKQASDSLIEHFGQDKLLCEITKVDANRWRKTITEGLADSTIAQRVKVARQMFLQAVEWDWIPSSPFGKLKTGSQANHARQHFVSREDAAAVIAKCHDPTYRLMFALSRWGGLRCPSEHLALEWRHVDFAGGSIGVMSPKTGWRVLPMFPELRPFLEEAKNLASPGAVHVVEQIRSSATNFRTGLRRIIKRAGLKPWPKLFHNLRSSRETELHRDHPLQDVCKWIGNSPVVAAKHYLQATGAEFAKASGMSAHMCAQQTAAGSGKQQNAATKTAENPDGFGGLLPAAGVCDQISKYMQNSNGCGRTRMASTSFSRLYLIQ